MVPGPLSLAGEQSFFRAPELSWGKDRQGGIREKVYRDRPMTLRPGTWSHMGKDLDRFFI